MRTRNMLEKCIMHFILGLGSIIMIIPFLWMLSTSLKAPDKILELPPQLIPNPVNIDSYITVWVNLKFLIYTLNSFYIVSLNVVGTVISCAIVAFGFAMFNFRGKKLLFLLMLGTIMMPAQVTMIPQYFIWKELGALGSYLPLILPSFFGGAFGIFLLHQNYKSIPIALYEAAMIDGCNPLKILYKIYLPMSVPSITTLVVFTFLGTWNNTLGPLIYIKKRELYTLTLGLLSLNNSSEMAANMGIKMAAAAITMTPVILVFLLAQKYFVEGIANSGIKG